MKTTSDITKATLPGEKSLFRLLDAEENFLLDLICRKGELPQPGQKVFDPANPSRFIILPACRVTDLRDKVMERGRITAAMPDLDRSADRCADQLRRLPAGTLRQKNPHIYKVSISQGLQHLRAQLMERYAGG